MKLFNRLFLFVHVITILGSSMSAEKEGRSSLEKSSGKENQGPEGTSEKQRRRKLASTRGFPKKEKSGKSKENVKEAGLKESKSTDNPQNQPEQNN